MKISLIGASGLVDSSLLELIKQNYNSIQNIDKQQSIFHKEITTVVNVFDIKLPKKHQYYNIARRRTPRRRLPYFTLLRCKCRRYAEHIGSDGC